MSVSTSMRWTAEEMDLLDQVRERLREKFLRSAPYPEVIGDRKLIRFIRGHGHVLDTACEMIEKFLDWRFENNVDEIRKDIFENKLTPEKFPGAEIVFRNVKVMVYNMLDPSDPNYMNAHPLCVEPWTSPSLFSEIDLEDYIKFRIYCLEYVAMGLEQVSHEVISFASNIPLHFLMSLFCFFFFTL